MHLPKAKPIFGKVGKVSFFKKKGLFWGPEKIFNFVLGRKIAGIMDGTLKVAVRLYRTVFKNPSKSLVLQAKNSIETFWFIFQHCKSAS